MENKEMSFKQFVLQLLEWKDYLLKKWKVLLLFVVLGALIGAVYSFLTPAKYIAETNLILSENNNTLVNPLATLGLGGQEPQGLFDGDNLIWLYSSDVMVRQTLLKRVKNENNKDELLINWLIRIDKGLAKYINKLKSNNPKANVNFRNDMDSSLLPIDQNRILSYAIQLINKDYLEVGAVPKTTGLIKVKISSKNELFSKTFSDNLVQQVNHFYITNKTQKAAKQVEILNNKVSELDLATNKSIYSTAKSIENVPYPNPNLSTTRVETQRSGIDVDINTQLYSQLVQQLEAAKITLSELTPLIQIVDSPILPLKINKPSPILMPIIAGMLFFMLGIGFVLIRLFFKGLNLKANT